MIATKSSVSYLSAFGIARSTIQGSPLGDEEARRTHAFWSACNYLALGMIYLQVNPLLRERSPTTAQIIRTFRCAGYKERGNINTPMELAMDNEIDTLTTDVIDRVPKLQSTLKRSSRTCRLLVVTMRTNSASTDRMYLSGIGRLGHCRCRLPIWSEVLMNQLNSTRGN